VARLPVEFAGDTGRVGASAVVSRHSCWSSQSPSGLLTAVVVCLASGVWRTCREPGLSPAGPLWTEVVGMKPRTGVLCRGICPGFVGRSIRPRASPS
jgi:hypothetical protein